MTQPEAKAIRNFMSTILSMDEIWLPPRRTQERHHARNPRVAHEPSIDYVVTKIPRIAFENFPLGLCRRPPFTLITQMKSVGEAMAIGRTFKDGEHARLACRFRRPRRNHLRATSDSFSEALNDARVGACAPHGSLEIGRSGLRQQLCAIVTGAVGCRADIEEVRG